MSGGRFPSRRPARWVVAAFLAHLVPVAVHLSCPAADWPQYRGPDFDSSSPETLRTHWTERPPSVLWRVTPGNGWSSPVVAGNRLVTLAKRDGSEVAIALNSTTGAELWSTRVDQAAYDNLAGYDDALDGPRSTPALVGDRVYVLTSHLKLLALHAGTGEILWERDFLAEFPGTSNIPWQNAASPVVVGDLLYLNSNTPGGTLTAIRTSDGTTAWRTGAFPLTHASPTPMRFGDRSQIVFLTRSGLVSLTPDSGEQLWHYSFSASPTSTAASPVAAGDWVYASSAYGLGSWVARITHDGTRFNVTQSSFQRSTSFQNHWATAVHHEGFLYHIAERSLRSLACYDPSTTANRWTTDRVGSSNPGFASLIKVGSHLVVLTEPGEVVLVQPSPDRYLELGRFQALDRYCWNQPAFSRGRLFARSSTEIVALDLAPDLPSLPNLRLAVAPAAPGRLVLRTTAESGEPLDDSARNTIILESTTAWSAGITAWTDLTVSWQLRDGGLETEIDTTTPATRFLRLRTPASTTAVSSQSSP